APAALTVRVCDSISCELAGAQELLKKLSFGKDVRVITAPCVGRCESAPCVVVGQNPVANATVDSVKKAVAEKNTSCAATSYVDFDSYKSKGGYKLAAECYSGKRSVEEITK